MKTRQLVGFYVGLRQQWREIKSHALLAGSMQIYSLLLLLLNFIFVILLRVCAASSARRARRIASTSGYSPKPPLILTSLGKHALLSAH